MVSILEVYSFNDWFFTIISLLFIFPIYFSIRNYKRTGSADYFILAGLFVSYIIKWIISPVFFYVMRTGTYIDLSPLFRFTLVLADSCVYLCYFLHVTRFRWEKTPSLLLYAYLCYFGIFELYHTLALFIPELLVFEVDFLILSIPVRLAILGFLIFNYITISPENPTSRITIAKGIWITVAALLFINYSLNGINLVLYRVPLADLSYLISYPVALLFFVLPILVPEALLITQVQIVRAVNLYKLISTFPTEARGTISQDKLVNYILSLPKDLIDR